MLGLIEAMDKFDPSLGYEFSTYATWDIWKSMKAQISRMGPIVAKSSVLKGVNKMIKYTERLRKELQREPTARDLAKSLDVTIGDLQLYFNAMSGILSLDGLVDEENEDSPLYIGSVDGGEASNTIVFNKLLFEELDSVFRDAMKCLSDKQRTVIILYYGLGGRMPHSLREVGILLGCNIKCVRQHIEQGINHLKIAGGDKLRCALKNVIEGRME